MAVVSIATLKSYFETGDVPTELQYIDLMDTLNACTIEETTVTAIPTGATPSLAVNTDPVRYKRKKVWASGDTTDITFTLTDLVEDKEVHLMLFNNSGSARAITFGNATQSLRGDTANVSGAVLQIADAAIVEVHMKVVSDGTTTTVITQISED